MHADAHPTHRRPVSDHLWRPQEHRNPILLPWVEPAQRADGSGPAASPGGQLKGFLRLQYVPIEAAGHVQVRSHFPAV